MTLNRFEVSRDGQRWREIDPTLVLSVLADQYPSLLAFVLADLRDGLIVAAWHQYYRLAPDRGVMRPADASG